MGVPDELYGEEVAAVVVLKTGAKTSEQEVIDFCKARLADYKCPKTVRFVEDIPKGPTGKLLKRELAQMFSRVMRSDWRNLHDRSCVLGLRSISQAPRSHSAQIPIMIGENHLP